MKFYFATISFALTMAALAGGALLWDGSYYLYCALNSGNPCVSNNRWITLILHFPVLTAACFTHDIHILQIIFGLTYALVPIFILLISWWVVRESALHLFMWVAFGLGFGTLLLQLHFVAEAIISVQLAWPIFLAQFMPGSKKIHLTVSILAVFLLISHPFAIGFFIMFAVSALLVGWRVPLLRREKWGWAGVWIALALLALARLTFASSAYEAERLSFSVIQEGYQALRGGVGVAVSSIFVMAVLVFVSAYGNLKSNPQWLQRIKEGQVACIFLSTALLLIWASHPQAWNSSFAYRVVVPLVSLPFFALAGLDGYFSLVHPADPDAPEPWNWRLRNIQGIGISFALILCFQSWSWHHLQNKLVTIMAENPAACLSLDQVSDQFEGGQMPFHHWSITTLSLFLQGNTPQKVITEQPCDQIDFSRSMPVNGWEVQPWGTNRVFDMSLLEEALR